VDVSSVHLIGIAGSGLSAIARVLAGSGYTVSGSDRQASPFLKGLREAGVQVRLGHSPENVSGADLVVRSSAIGDDNVEVQAARAAGIPVLKRADFLGQLMEERTGIAVAGTHGKTTTTAMIAWMLYSLEQDPSFIIGGLLRNLDTNARAGKGQAFVIEADEYDRMFLGLRPKIAVVTNVEYDHPDCYASPEDYHQAFVAFTGRLAPGGVLLACGDHPGSVRLYEEASRSDLRAFMYGIENPACHYHAKDLTPNPEGGLSFEFAIDNSPVTVRVTLQVPGRHNVLNALAALAVAHHLGLSLDEAAQSLVLYQGAGRRFEVRGEAGRVTVIDDYAHHPTEIKATLSAARDRYPGQELWVVWQPHTYSRTQTLFDEFASAFEDADHVLVTEVYAAREPVSNEFSARQIVPAMEHPDAHFVPGIEEATLYLLDHLHPGNVLLVLSAGDADQISERVLASL